MSTDARLHAYLLAEKHKRFDQEALLRGFAAACPEYDGTGEQRARLFDSLMELKQQGLVRLPQAANKWDSVGNPKLPHFVTIVREQRARQDFSQTAWVPELANVATSARREDQLATLSRLNEFIIGNRSKLSRVVPYRERALEIFGDEKYFKSGAIRGDTLYGLIPLSVIGAMNPEPPLPREDFDAPGRPLLLVENHHTYWSLLRWNTTARKYASIAYVSGNTYANAGKALADAMQRANVKQAEHFGDIDPEGLRIGVTMCTYLKEHGMPALRPAAALYRWLFDHGRRRSFAGATPTASAAALGWLGEELGLRALELFSKGLWVPQESLGLEQLDKLIA